MSTSSTIREAIEQTELICKAYLEGLSDADLLVRPGPGLNHINWQVGHLISSEHEMIEIACPGQMPALPAGFAERYGKGTATSDAPQDFLTKAELLSILDEQRAGTLSLLDQQTEADFARESGVPYAPTVRSLFLMQSIHWMMHAGQWVVVRRQLGLPALF